MQALEASRLSPGPVAAPAAAIADAALVPIAPLWRALLILYFAYWPVIAPILSMLLHGTDDPVAVERSAVRIASGLLALLPLLMPRFAGIPAGWLHPLILPALVSDAMNAVKSPVDLIAPLLIWLQPLSTFSANEMLVGWGRDAVYGVMLKAESLTLLSQLALLCGFLLIKWSPMHLRLRPPARPTGRMVVIFLLMFVAFAAFLQSRGGVSAHIASFGLGRHKELGELGYILGVFRAAPVLLTIWYALDRKAIRSPIFIAMIGMTCAMQFIASGSRSGVIFPLIAIALVHVYHTRRLPLAAIIAVGLLTPLAVGVLGQIRFSTWQGSATGAVDYSAITAFDLEQTLEVAANNVEYRNFTNPSLPTFAKVPDETGLLWGTSYVGGLLFFVPRAIWPEKPRGIGAYAVSEVMQAGRGVAGPYQGAGASPGAVAEAYWNFHLFGIVGVYFLFGAFLSWAARSMMMNAGNAAAVPLYTTTLLNFSEPGTGQIGPYAQLIVVILATYWLLGMWSRRAGAV